MSAPAQRTRNLLQLVISVALLLLALIIFANRQAILDRLIVWQYEPSPAIAAIAERSQLSDSGEFLFYASQPQLLDRKAFNNVCRSDATEHTAVLGCYTHSQIYLFNIDNPQLDGIKEVTAAHEMLHAAYQRLDDKERERVDALIDQQSFGDQEQRIKGLLAQYAQSEPGERLNELHSILGTEVATLNPELESYYARYFSDRAQVVAISDRYQSVFSELEARQASLVSELNQLADELERRTAVYKRELQVLQADIKSFNSRASSGEMSRAEYERERADLERRQQALRTEYDRIQALVDAYEAKRVELATINSQSSALNRSINSSIVAPQEEING